MSQWFRTYNDLVDDPKAQLLSDALFRAMVNLWCLASANGGALPAIAAVAFKLRMKPDRAARVLTDLSAAGLLDEIDGTFRPHNWNARQYKSDGSTERVKRFRERSNPQNETFHGTFPKQDQIQKTDTEAEKEVREKRARGSRLPLEWEPLDADLEYAKARGFRLIDAKTEALKFRNYWTAKAGAGGIKLDWSRTWQNWILNSHPQNGAQNGTSQHQPAGVIAAARAFRKQLESQDDLAVDRAPVLGLPAR